MSERHPLSETQINFSECTDIELFALQSLYEERVRRSTESLEDIQAEVTRRKGAIALIPLQRELTLPEQLDQARELGGPIPA